MPLIQIPSPTSLWLSPGTRTRWHPTQPHPTWAGAMGPAGPHRAPPLPGGWEGMPWITSFDLDCRNVMRCHEMSMRCLDLNLTSQFLPKPLVLQHPTTVLVPAADRCTMVPHGAPWRPMAPPTNGPGDLHPGRPSSRDPPSPRSPHASPSWPSLGLVAAAAGGRSWGYTNGAIGGYQLSFFGGGWNSVLNASCWRMILSPKQILGKNRGRWGRKLKRPTW